MDANPKEKKILAAELGDTLPGGPEPEATAESSSTRPDEDIPHAWILQYRPDDMVTKWTSEATPGSELPWKAGNGVPRAMKAGDPVIYWRTIHPENPKDRGGLVGTGHVISVETKTPDGIVRLPTRVLQFDEEKTIDRDEVIRYASIDRTNWQGSILSLPWPQAEKVDELLPNMGRRSLFEKWSDTGLKPDVLDDSDSQIRVRRDDAQLDHDALGRAPLAVSLAWMLHEIWCTEQGLAPFPNRSPQGDAAGFVAHIDAPWGGGKTSFANLVARTLNPGLDGKTPEFLQALYSGRGDMSGLFISAAHELGGLKDHESGKYLWDQGARQPWIIVPFNAWLNQHVAPPWWGFYQTIRKTCFAALSREGVPVVEQKEGGAYDTRCDGRRERFARMRRLWLKEIWWRLTAPKVKFQFAVTAVSAIVAWLILTYGGAEVENGKVVFSTSSDIGLVLAFLTGAGTFLSAATTVVADALAPGRNVLGERVSLGTADPFLRFRRHFSEMMQEIERPVLVIIDDIDRCEPKFIVEMTRGLQTILKSPRVVYLLLGDRNWIEKAFAICHENMNDIDVGSEHTFGGRFAEKAIQLSYVLPGIGEHKEGYVQEVLMGSSELSEEWPSVEQREALRDSFSNAKSAKEIDKAGTEALEGDSEEPGSSGRAYRRVVREEIVLGRAARKEDVENLIRHRLQPLARFLPENPRHIKRIINAIYMYQNSILLSEEDAGAEQFGGAPWRQLVVGVVLMIGFPRSWSNLAKHPEMADALIAKEKELPNSAGTSTDREAIYAELRRNTRFVELLSDAKLRSADDDEALETRITSDVVRWLNRVIPAA